MGEDCQEYQLQNAFIAEKCKVESYFKEYYLVCLKDTEAYCVRVKFQHISNIQHACKSLTEKGTALITNSI